MLQFRLRDGAALQVANLEAGLPYHAAFADSYPAFVELREKYDRPDFPPATWCSSSRRRPR